MRAQFIPQSSYMKITSATKTISPSQISYAVGDSFNPNGLEVTIADSSKSFLVSYNEGRYEDVGGPLTTADTSEEIQIYETHSRGKITQTISVS